MRDRSKQGNAMKLRPIGSIADWAAGLGLLLWYAGFYWTVGMGHGRTDMPAALAGAAAVYVGARVLVSRYQRPGRHRPGVIALPTASIIGAWLGVSSAYWLDPSIRSLGAGSHPRQTLVAPNASASGKRIGLALSGGGYRAALFHAGVLASLEELGLPPHQISSVSGGSIVGAYYALGGDPHDFVEIVGGDRLDLKRFIAMFPTSLRLLCPKQVPFTNITFEVCGFDQLDAQVALLNRVLFDGATMDRLRKDGRSDIMMNTTDVRAGAALGLNPGYTLLRGRDRPYVFRTGDVAIIDSAFNQVAQVVATSGAFPGAFPPKRLQAEFRAPPLAVTPFDDLPTKETLPNGSRHYLIDFLLADGGILDNSGMRTLFDMHFLAHRAGEPQCLPYPLDLADNLPPIGPPPFILNETDREQWGPLAIDKRKAQEATLGLRPSDNWKVDIVIGSNGGAPIKISDPGGAIGALNRAVSLASSFSKYSSPRRVCEPASVTLDPEFFAFPGEFADRWGFPTNPQSYSRKRLTPDVRGSLMSLSPAAGFEPKVALLAAVLPNRSKADSLLAAFVASSSKTRRRLRPNRLDSEPPTPAWARDLATLTEWLVKCSDENVLEFFPALPDNGTCAEISLATALQVDLNHSLKVFRSTSTLQSRIPPGDARAIFRLGQQLALRMAPLIEFQLRLPYNTSLTGHIRPYPTSEPVSQPKKP
jgi:predicted acylesterase/phospholipase RssA